MQTLEVEKSLSLKRLPDGEIGELLDTREIFSIITKNSQTKCIVGQIP